MTVSTLRSSETGNNVCGFWARDIVLRRKERDVRLSLREDVVQEGSGLRVPSHCGCYDFEWILCCISFREVVAITVVSYKGRCVRERCAATAQHSDFGLDISPRGLGALFIRNQLLMVTSLDGSSSPEFEVTHVYM